MKRATYEILDFKVIQYNGLYPVTFFCWGQDNRWHLFVLKTVGELTEYSELFLF